MANTVRNKPRAGRTTTIEEPNPLDKIQFTYEKNKKQINAVVTVVLVLIVGFFAYRTLYKEPRNRKASFAISYAQQYFQQDSLIMALNGDGQHDGFLRIIKKYSGTSTANLANYYAGICFLQMHDAQKAIKYLKDFDAHGTKVEYAAFGALGDAYMETNNVKEGINYYKKASANEDDNLLTPLYLYRAAVAYELSNQPKDAIESYKKIRDKYPQSMQAREVDKNLARLGVLE